MTKTREITARDYGIILREGPERLFVSPTKYALAIIALETPGKIHSRLRVHAHENGTSYDDLVQKVTKGVVQTHGSKNLLNVSGRNTVSNVRRMGPRITADVKSRTKGVNTIFIGTKQVEVECPCPDTFWDKIKNYSIECAHVATLDTALALDNRLGSRIEDTITGLAPVDRPEIRMPFAFL